MTIYLYFRMQNRLILDHLYVYSESSNCIDDKSKNMTIINPSNRLVYTDYLFTGLMPPLENGCIEIDNEGTIISIFDNPTTQIKNKASYFPGAIIPGMVNAHTHLELSMLKDVVVPGRGMASFIASIASQRGKTSLENQKEAITNALKDLNNQGVIGLGDICNTPLSFEPKSKSPLRTHNFIEVFGLDSTKADQIINQALETLTEAQNMDCGSTSLTPHAPYSLSQELIINLHNYLINTNQPVSIHLAESEQEIELLESRKGEMAELFEKTKMLKNLPDDFRSPVDMVKALIPKTCRLLTVHNTELNETMIADLKLNYNDLWFCICPTSNYYINKTSPDIQLLNSSKTPIVIGTDSSASNPNLQMAEELMAIQRLAPTLPAWVIIKWATANGARLFHWDDLGELKPGTKPGLVWLKGVTSGEHLPYQGLTTHRLA